MLDSLRERHEVGDFVGIEVVAEPDSFEALVHVLQLLHGVVNLLDVPQAADLALLLLDVGEEFGCQVVLDE